MRFPWVIISLMGWAFTLYYASMPVGDWYELRSVRMTDNYVERGDPLSRELVVDRSINRSFRGWYRVEEHLHVADDTWVTIAACENEHAVNYRPDAALPGQVTVGWWAWGDCDLLPRVHVSRPEEQEFRLCTWVSIEVIPILPVFRKTTIPTCTAPYRGRAIPRP